MSPAARRAALLVPLEPDAHIGDDQSEIFRLALID
jgi:hypothetical protein